MKDPHQIPGTRALYDSTSVYISKIVDMISNLNIFFWSSNITTIKKNILNTLVHIYGCLRLVASHIR